MLPRVLLTRLSESILHTEAMLQEAIERAQPIPALQSSFHTEPSSPLAVKGAKKLLWLGATHDLCEIGINKEYVTKRWLLSNCAYHGSWDLLFKVLDDAWDVYGQNWVNCLRTGLLNIG